MSTSPANAHPAVDRETAHAFAHVWEVIAAASVKESERIHALAARERWHRVAHASIVAQAEPQISPAPVPGSAPVVPIRAPGVDGGTRSAIHAEILDVLDALPDDSGLSRRAAA